MTAPNYITLEQAKDYVGQIDASVTVLDSIFEQAISTASRAIDGYTSRRFYADTTATPRLYGRNAIVQSQWSWVGVRLQVDDIADPASIVVEVGNNADGTFATTWATTDFFTAPLNGVVDGIEGFPVTEIVADSTKRIFPIFPTTLRPQVKVTAKWGWSAIPDPIVTTTLMMTLDLVKMKDGPFGNIGFANYGPMKARANLVVAQLLDKTYCKTDIGIA